MIPEWVRARGSVINQSFSEEERYRVLSGLSAAGRAIPPDEDARRVLGVMNRPWRQEELNELPEHLRAFYAAVHGLAAQFSGDVKLEAVGDIRGAFAINLRTAIKWAAIKRRENAARAGIIEERRTGDEEYMRYVAMREIRSIRQEQIKQLTDTALRSLEIVFGGNTPAETTPGGEQ